MELNEFYANLIQTAKCRNMSNQTSGARFIRISIKIYGRTLVLLSDEQLAKTFELKNLIEKSVRNTELTFTPMQQGS